MAPRVHRERVGSDLLKFKTRLLLPFVRSSHDLRRHRDLHPLQVHRLRRRLPGRLLPRRARISSSSTPTNASTARCASRSARSRRSSRRTTFRAASSSSRRSMPSLSKLWKPIIERKPAPPDADEWKDVPRQAFPIAALSRIPRKRCLRAFKPHELPMIRHCAVVTLMMLSTAAVAQNERATRSRRCCADAAAPQTLLRPQRCCAPQHGRRAVDAAIPSRAAKRRRCAKAATASKAGARRFPRSTACRRLGGQHAGVPGERAQAVQERRPQPSVDARDRRQSLRR